MTFGDWLAAISQSTAPAGKSFGPHWAYVILSLMIPGALGLIMASILKAVEKIFGIKLGRDDI
jgi:ABC-type phosphate transport system permease subunit